MKFFNIILHFVNPAQRFYSFLIGLKRVTDVKGVLDWLEFLGKRFFYFYSWRFWHIILFRCKYKLASARAFLSIRESELEVNVGHPSSMLLENSQMFLDFVY